jgi:hypothetical protein
VVEVLPQSKQAGGLSTLPWCMKDKIFLLIYEIEDLIEIEPGEWGKTVMILAVDRTGGIKEPHPINISVAGNIGLRIAGKN